MSVASTKVYRLSSKLWAVSHLHIGDMRACTVMDTDGQFHAEPDELSNSRITTGILLEGCRFAFEHFPQTWPGNP